MLDYRPLHAQLGKYSNDSLGERTKFKHIVGRHSRCISVEVTVNVLTRGMSIAT